MLLSIITLYALEDKYLDQSDVATYLLGLGGSFYIIILYFFIKPNFLKHTLLRWGIAAIDGVALGLMLILLNQGTPEIVFYLFTILTVLITAVSIGRAATYILISSCAIVLVGAAVIRHDSLYGWVEVISVPVATIIINETVLRLTEVMQQNIRRLETINIFARQIATSLETERVISILNTAIQNALEADTYFVALLDREEIDLKLFYDDGEFYEGVRLLMKGTLSGWVMRTRQSLFIPDLRAEAELALEGVEQVIIGKNKSSLSWIGVPMMTNRVLGMIALASYQPNAFDRNTLELLENLAQLAALALDNTYHHAEVEEQSRLDSLTKVYNHGWFIKLLKEQLENARSSRQPLSVIMLDVDYFKSYNDTYGHIMGDKVLTTLIAIIRVHIHQTDLIGRWGGEEFAVALPNTTGAQAMQVAERIQKTMSELALEHAEKGSVPAPTVSQGIAAFPRDADETFKLIDLADKRLYTAKERGRDQIEPEASHWQAPQ